MLQYCQILSLYKQKYTPLPHQSFPAWIWKKQYSKLLCPYPLQKVWRTPILLYSHTYTSTALYFITMLTPLLPCTLFPCLHLYCLVLYSHAYTSTVLYFIPMLTPLLPCTLFPCLHLYCLVLYSHAYTSYCLVPYKMFWNLVYKIILLLRYWAS